MRVIDAERFVSLIKRDDFDYTVWQREYFDKMEPGEFGAKAKSSKSTNRFAAFNIYGTQVPALPT